MVISLTSGVPSYVFKFLYSRTQSSKSQSRLGTRDTVPSFVPDDGDVPSLRRMLSTSFRRSSNQSSSIELTGVYNRRRTLSAALSQRNVTLTFTAVDTDGAAATEDSERREAAAEKRGGRKASVAPSLETLREHKEEGRDRPTSEETSNGIQDNMKRRPSNSSVTLVEDDENKSSGNAPRVSEGGVIDVNGTELSQSRSLNEKSNSHRKPSMSISSCGSDFLERPQSPSNMSQTNELQPPERPRSPSRSQSAHKDRHLSVDSPREPSISTGSIGSIHELDGKTPIASNGTDAALEISQPRQPKTERTKPLWQPRVKILILFFVFLWTLLCAFTILVLSLDFDIPESTVSSSGFYDAFRCSGEAATTDVGEDADDLTSITEQWLTSALIASAIDIFISQPLWLIVNSMYRVLKFERRLKVRRVSVAKANSG